MTNYLFKTKNQPIFAGYLEQSVLGLFLKIHLCHLNL